MTATDTTLQDLPLAPKLSVRVPWRILFGPNRLRFLRFVDQAAGKSPIIRLRFGPRTVHLVRDADAAGEILLARANDFSKGPELGVYSRPLLGSGLLTSEGDFHKAQRKTINPVFAHRRIVAYAEPMAQATEEMAAGWRDGESVDIDREMTRLTLRIVGETLFGVTGMDDGADKLGHSLSVAMRYFIGVIRSPLRPPFATIPFWKRDVTSAMAHLDSAVFQMIAERRATGASGNDLLSLLLSARDDDGKPMPDKQVRDEAMTLFLAGHETTANALAWTFYLLAKHPIIYARVQSEVDDHLQGRTPTYADLDQMPYTLQAIKEAMRLYPPAYAFMRQAIRDTEVAGFRLSARTTTILSVYLLHRRPEYFPEPDRFDPDRFAPGAEKTRPRFAYLPFSGGSRACIGAAFALMEAHLVVVTLLQRASITLARPEHEQETETLITLRPKDGIPMRITKRR